MKEKLRHSRKFQITIIGIILDSIGLITILFLMDTANERYNEQIISLYGSYALAITAILTGFMGAKLYQERNDSK